MLFTIDAKRDKDHLSIQCPYIKMKLGCILNGETFVNYIMLHNILSV